MDDQPRRFLLAISCAAMLFAVQVHQFRAQDGAAELNWHPSVVAERSKDIIEAVMEHHIEPPTRQQLVLEVLRAVADATHQRLPPEMSVQISTIGDADAIYSLLNEELERLGLNGQSADWMKAAVLDRLSRVVPGGLEIVLQSEHAVNEQLAANQYVGIGVGAGIDSQAERMNFMRVVEGGTAAAAGLLAGDVVQSVDGKDTLKVPLGEVIQWLRGPEGTTVRLTVRSPGAESREVEIVRRVVPIRTLNLVPQHENSAAALVRLDRISASSVHELRKVIVDLPQAVTTMILDLRHSGNGSLHHLHLLADALLEEGALGSVETRSGIRPLNAEAGTIVGILRPVIVYKPGHSEQIDWLAAVAEQNGVSVYRDEFTFSEGLDEPAAMAQTLTEFVPLDQGTHYIGLATSRLLTAGEQRRSTTDTVGTLLEPKVSTKGGTLEWLTNLAGIDDEPRSLSRPMGIVVRRDGARSIQPFDPRFKMPKGPTGDQVLIDQIMAKE